MTQPVYLGDPTTAAGYRLAGFAVRTPDATEARAAFDDALDEAPLVVLSPTVAGWLDPDALDNAIATANPPVALVADVSEPPRSLAGTVRRALGVES
jgi:vacuolar-type H+-ATPase subunit F/Vma7